MVANKELELLLIDIVKNKKPLSYDLDIDINGLNYSSDLFNTINLSVATDIFFNDEVRIKTINNYMYLRSKKLVRMINKICNLKRQHRDHLIQKEKRKLDNKILDNVINDVKRIF
jgi:hypothetical protein